MSIKGGTIFEAGMIWDGVTKKMREEKWHELKDERWIYEAGCWWDAITDKMRNERFKELKNLEYILKALEYWSGIDTDDVFEKILTSEIKSDFHDVFFYHGIYRYISDVNIYIHKSFYKTKNQVFEKLLSGEINHELFVKNYPVIREKMLLGPGLKEEILSEFDHFYENISNN